MTREPKSLPQMKINLKVKDIFGFRFEDFEFVGYSPDAAIAAPVAV